MIVGLAHLGFWLCVLMGLTQLHIWPCMLAKSLKMVHASFRLHICQSHVSIHLVSHVMHSATCGIVWFRQDSSTRRPVGVPGMVDQP